MFGLWHNVSQFHIKTSPQKEKLKPVLSLNLSNMLALDAATDP